MFSLYCNPDLDDCNFDCLLIPMAVVQAEDVCASFLFVGYLIDHHREWLGSTSTNRHGVASFDIASQNMKRMVVCPTLARIVTLDLLVMDVPELVRIAVVAPIGNSDNSSLSTAISTAQAV